MRSNLVKIKPFFCKKVDLKDDETTKFEVVSANNKEVAWKVSNSEEGFSAIVFDLISVKATKKEIEEIVGSEDIKCYFIFENQISADKEKSKISVASNFDCFIYCPEDEKIELFYDNSYNYLDAPKRVERKNVKAKVYNTSLIGLINLYTKLGDALFSQNIRYGKKNPGLYGAFMEYITRELIQVGAIDESIIDDSMKVKMSTIESDADLFWLKHNGVTILSKNFIDRNNSVVLNLIDTSVVNGAQTVFNLYIARNEIAKTYGKSEEELVSKLKEKIDNILENIMIKTIVISIDDDAMAREITKGLNSQSTITTYDIINNTSDIEEINNKLSPDIHVMKYGEKGKNAKISLSVMDFLKWSSNINGKPGYSKNYNYNNAKDDIAKIKLIYLEETKKYDFIKKIKNHEKIYSFWDSKRKEILEKLKEEYDEEMLNNICKYAKNYFASYCINFEKSNYEESLKEFVDIISNIKNKSKEYKVQLDDFKKDDLFKEICEMRSIK